MKKHNFDAKINHLLSYKSKSRAIIVALIVSNIILAIGLVIGTGREKIVLIPSSNPDSSYWISNNKISNEYMEIMSRNLLSLTLDVSPETVRSQYDAFLRFVTPDLRSYIVENLKKSAENIINNDIAQSFYVDTIKVVPISQTTYVVGNLATYVNNQQVTNIHQLYKIKYATDDMTVKIKEYRLLDPQRDSAELKGIGL